MTANEAGRVVIVGGGHNGLIAAFYLARSGFAPLVLERREIVGGIAATEEIHPGFRCPTLVHVAGPLLPDVAKDLQLASVGRHSSIISLHPNEHALRIYQDPQRTAAELATLSSHDAQRYPQFHASFKEIGAALEPLISVPPPDIDDLRIQDYLHLGKAGLKFRGLDRKDAYRLLRYGAMPVADLASEWFENELLRATVAARGIFGCFAGPLSPGTSNGLLMQAAFGADPLLMGAGTDSIATVLAKAASAAGAEIRTNANV